MHFSTLTSIAPQLLLLFTLLGRFRLWRGQFEVITLLIHPRPNLLPSTAPTPKIPIALRHLQRLHHNPLLLLVIPDFRVAGHREILPQGMSIEPIIRHDASQIRMVHKKDPKKVIDLTLVPICAIVKGTDGGHGGGFVGVGFHADARVVPDTEEVVDDFEALVLCGVVNGGYVGDLGVFGAGVVFEEGEDGDDARGGNVDGELVFPDAKLLDVLG